MQGNVEDMYRDRANKCKKTLRVILTAVIPVLAMLFLFREADIRQRADHSGIPDAVSSRTVNGECYLDVVANEDRIEDEAEFARTVVQMCRDNSFHSMRLSTDQTGYPSRLEIKVYLQRADVNTVEPELEIRYEPAEEPDEEKPDEEKADAEGAKGTGVKEAGYNIKDDEEKYALYIDDKDIP